MNPRSLLTLASGYRTYIAAAGLASLAFYHLTVGDGDQAVHYLLEAATAAGIRAAITKS